MRKCEKKDMTVAGSYRKKAYVHGKTTLLSAL